MGGGGEYVLRYSSEGVMQIPYLPEFQIFATRLISDLRRISFWSLKTLFLAGRGGGGEEGMGVRTGSLVFLCLVLAYLKLSGVLLSGHICTPPRLNNPWDCLLLMTAAFS